jgi:hypothetical protein
MPSAAHTSTLVVRHMLCLIALQAVIHLQCRRAWLDALDDALRLPLQHLHWLNCHRQGVSVSTTHVLAQVSRALL